MKTRLSLLIILILNIHILRLDVFAFVTNQTAGIVIGQPNMTSCTLNNGGVNANSLASPQGVYSDGNKLYIADYNNNRVLIYNHIPTNNSAAADVVIGQPNMISHNANNGGLNANTLWCPRGVYSDGTRLLITDVANSRVLIFNQIPTWNNATADIVIGQPNMTSNTWGTSANSLAYPYCVYSDNTKLFIADEGNTRVLIYNQIPTQNNVAADVVIGQLNMTSNVAGISANSLSAPNSVYSDGTQLYISDNGNSRVLIYNHIPTSNNASADLVIGQINMTSNISGTSANLLSYPRCVYSGNNRLYVMDTNNNRFLIYNQIPAQNNVAANIVIGQQGMNSSSPNQGGGPQNTTLYDPNAFCADGQYLYVADTSNNRVLIYSYDPLNWQPIYVRAISPTHALSGNVASVEIDGVFNPTTPTVQLVNEITSVVGTGVKLISTNKISCQFNLQVFPGVFNLQVTQNERTNVLPTSFFVTNPVIQPVQWNVQDLGSTWNGGTPPNPGAIASIAMGDIARDGKQELVIANQDLKIYIAKKASTWSITALPQELEYFKRLVIADGDQDEHPDAFCGTSSQNIYQYSGSAWTKILSSAGVTTTAMASGDGDNDGRNEIYLAGADGHVYQAKCDAGIWCTSDLGHGAQTMLAIAAGDGNGDGIMEVYATSHDHNIYPFTYSNGSWSQGSAINTVSTDMEALIVGDGDGDGVSELYGANADGKIYQFKWTNGVWVTQPIPVSTSPVYGLTISDADNDGNDEIYAACGNGHLYRVVKVNGAWQSTDMGNAGTPLYALTVGDGEGNNQFEVYAVGANGHIYQFKAVSGSTSTPTPTPATIIPQNYFKIFHSQINPIHGEQARIRWTQPQAGPVHITIYNLLGDKMANPLEGQSFSAGEYHEIDWNGRTQKGTKAGSGIYIVLLTAPGNDARGKIAVIK